MKQLGRFIAATTWAKKGGKYKHMKRAVEFLYKRKEGKGERKKCLKRSCDLCMACFQVREKKD